MVSHLLFVDLLAPGTERGDQHPEVSHAQRVDGVRRHVQHVGEVG